MFTNFKLITANDGKAFIYEFDKYSLERDLCKSQTTN